MIVDIYTHIFPERFFQELERGAPKLGNMGKRLRSVKKLFDLDLRFKDMDEIGADYRQIISLPNPPLEDIAEGAVANNLAKVANDSMAELCAKHPDRFPAFAAAVSMHDVDFSIREAERAIKMGARGVQTFTNIAGHPLDEPRFRPFFAAMAEHDLPVWLHPARTSAMADYASEPRSRFEMWWCFGWPYETTIAMCRLVFDGIYDRHPDLKLLLPHVGSTIPLLLGRFDYEFELMGIDLPFPGRPSEHLRRLYVDCVCESPSALRLAVETFGADRIMFGSDEPFWTAERAAKTLDAARLSATDVEMIRNGTAKVLFGLSGMQLDDK